MLDSKAAVERRSGILRRGERERGGAGEAADADAAGPGAGVGDRVVLAKLLPQFHTEPAEDVVALVAIRDGAGAPPPLGLAERPHGDVGGSGEIALGVHLHCVFAAAQRMKAGERWSAGSRRTQAPTSDSPTSRRSRVA